MLVNSSSNMAPETTILGTGLTFSFATAKADIERLEFYFHVNKTKGDKKKISIFLTSLDEESTNIVVKNFKKYENITWRAMKFRIKKESEIVILFKILSAKQKLHESSSSWLKRIIEIAEKAELEESFAKQIIAVTALYDKSSLLFKENFMNEKLYENYNHKIAVIKEAENKFTIKNQGSKPKLKTKKILKITEKRPKKIETHYVYNINSHKNEIKKKVVTINGEDIVAIEDTASDINIISKSLAEEKGLIIKKTSRIKVITFFKQETYLDEYVDITIKV